MRHTIYLYLTNLCNKMTFFKAHSLMFAQANGQTTGDLFLSTNRGVPRICTSPLLKADEKTSSQLQADPLHKWAK